MTDFALWITQELDRRGWSRVEAATRGGISPSAIDKVIGGYAKPGEKLCRGLALAFGMPAEDVFRLAGLLPPAVSDQRDLVTVLARLNELDPAARTQSVQLIHALLDYRAAAAGGKTVAEKRTKAPADPWLTGLGQKISAFDQDTAARTRWLIDEFMRLGASQINGFGLMLETLTGGDRSQLDEDDLEALTQRALQLLLGSDPQEIAGG